MGNGKLKWYTAAVFALVLTAVLLPVMKYVQQVRENRNLMEKMELRLAALGEEEIERQRNLARWYNYSLDLDTPGMKGVYWNILNLGNGAMAVLEVPELRVKLPVFHGEAGIAGHLPESHFPIGGRGSHTVLKVKAPYDWREGTAVYIDCLGRRSAYRVESIQVMGAGWPADWPGEQERLTILYDRGNLRTIVRCVPWSELTVRKTEEISFLCAAALAAVAAFCPVIPARLLKKRNRRDLRKRKYHGFIRENRRKKEQLRNYSCKILKIDV